MYATNKTKNRRGFTLTELLVVMTIILVIAALAAAFAPRVNDSTNLTRSVDQLEQWLLTAKMRAKRDGLATGLRFLQGPGDAAGMYSQFQYIQQPEPLSGGALVFVPTGGNPPPGGTLYQKLANGNIYLTGGILMKAPKDTAVVVFANVDFSLGGTPMLSQWLVQPGDFLEIRDSGVYLIAAPQPMPAPPPAMPFPPRTIWPVVPPVFKLQLGALSFIQTSGSVLYTPGPPPIYLTTTPYEQALDITQPTTNYRILRQPRLLEGEPPLQLPGNLAVDMNLIPKSIVTTNPPPPNDTTKIPWSNVQGGASGSPEILFSPSGAVIGSNTVNAKLLLTVYDPTMEPFDINRIGIIAIQSRNGFIGAYSAAPGAGSTGYDPFLFAEEGRDSGL